MKTVAVILFAVLVLAVFWRRMFPGTSKRHKRRMAQAGNLRDLLSSGSLLPAQAFAYLRKVNPYSFEELVLDGFEKAGYGNLPICVAKTQYSLSDDPKLLGRPEGFTLTVREARLAAGAGYIVILTGKIMTMPGLPKAPAALKIDIDSDGTVHGLF